MELSSGCKLETKFCPTQIPPPHFPRPVDLAMLRWAVPRPPGGAWPAVQPTSGRRTTDMSNEAFSGQWSPIFEFLSKNKQADISRSSSLTREEKSEAKSHLVPLLTHVFVLAHTAVGGGKNQEIWTNRRGSHGSILSHRKHKIVAVSWKCEWSG